MLTRPPLKSISGPVGIPIIDWDTELVSGDDGRTNPSVSSILNCKAECEKLIVTKIYDEFLN